MVNIVTTTKLLSLDLTATFEPDIRCLLTDQYSVPSIYLKELCVQTDFLPQKWGNKYHVYLNICKFLTSLTIETVERVNDATLATLDHACTHLTTLYIRFTVFENIQHFVLGSKINELTLQMVQRFEL